MLEDVVRQMKRSDGYGRLREKPIEAGDYKIAIHR